MMDPSFGVRRIRVRENSLYPSGERDSPMKIEGSYRRGLVLLRHRLAAAQVAENRARVAQVHAASARLPQVGSRAVQGGSGQTEPPENGLSEGSSTSSVRALSWSETG